MGEYKTEGSSTLSGLSEKKINTRLRKIIKSYLERARYIKDYLSYNPFEWEKFQVEINTSVDAISNEIALFVKDNKDDEAKAYKLKRLFENKLRKHFLYGEYITRSLAKHYGYPGDFRIIDDIYLNHPQSKGFERLWDNYFQRMGPSIATRNRKEDFKKMILDLVRSRSGNVRIMNLAAGPCRELKELFEGYPDEMSNVIFDCYDFDENAIAYARNLLGNIPNLSFHKKNAVRMALRKQIKDDISYDYDFIYSAGLFDYLDDRIATRLVANLKVLLKEGGLMCISNYRDKDSNPWASIMEWVAEWNLIYRTTEEFKKIFTDAGFAECEIQLEHEALKIMQYCVCKKASD